MRARTSLISTGLRSGVRGFDEAIERRPRGAGIERPGCPVETIAKVARFLRNDKRSGGVEERDVAIGNAHAVEHRAKLRRVVVRIAALADPRASPPEGRPLPGVTVKRRMLPFSSAATWVGPVVVISSRPSEPCTAQTRSEPSSFRTWVSGSSQTSEKTPRSWRVTPAGFDKRAEQVEDRAGAELDAHRRHVAHGGVVGLGEHEAETRVSSGSAAGPPGPRPSLTPRAASTSAVPDFDEAARLPCLATGTPQRRDDDRRQRRDVVAAGMVAAGADDVDRALGGRLDPQHASAHGRDRADDLVERFAAHPQRHQERAALGRRDFAGEKVVEGGARFLARQRRAGRDLGEVRT